MLKILFMLHIQCSVPTLLFCMVAKTRPSSQHPKLPILTFLPLFLNEMRNNQVVKFAINILLKIQFVMIMLYKQALQRLVLSKMIHNSPNIIFRHEKSRKPAKLVCGHLIIKCGHFYSKQRIICGRFLKKSTMCPDKYIHC